MFLELSEESLRRGGGSLTPEKLASFFDHTLLKPYTTEKDIKRVCAEAVKYGFYGVCVPPCYVKYAKKLLEKSKVKVVTVVGFPLGYSAPETKVYEARKAIKDGCDEIDMVINISKLKSKSYSYLENEIRKVVEAVKGKIVKVIIETCYLTREEKEVICKLAVKAGAQFIKTSTGFGPEGAKEEDIKLISEIVKGKAKIKAAGSIRTLNKALKMIKAGAARIGSSSSVKIMEEAIKNFQKKSQTHVFQEKRE